MKADTDITPGTHALIRGSYIPATARKRKWSKDRLSPIVEVVITSVSTCKRYCTVRTTKSKKKFHVKTEWMTIGFSNDGKW